MVNGKTMESFNIIDQKKNVVGVVRLFNGHTSSDENKHTNHFEKKQNIPSPNREKGSIQSENNIQYQCQFGNQPHCQIAEQFPVSVVILTSGGITYFNSLFLELLEAESKEQLTGIFLNNLLLQLSLSGDMGTDNHITNETSVRETRITCINGKQKDIEVLCKPIVFQQKNARLLILRDNIRKKEFESELENYKKNLEELVEQRTNEIKVVNDQLENEISWRKEAEAELMLKEERLDLAIEVADYGLWDLNLASGLIYYNEHFARILDIENRGIKRVDFQTYESFIDKDDVINFRKVFSEHINNRTEKLQIEHRINISDNRKKWVSVIGKVVERDHQMTPIRFIGRLEDITDRKVAEEKQKETMIMERELLELKSRFISMVSHEYRTPLSTIQTSIEILQMYDRELDELNRSQQLKKIQKAVDDMTEMINDVLTFSLTDTEEKPEDLLDVDIVSFTKNLLEEVKSSFHSLPSIQFYTNVVRYPLRFNERVYRHIFENLFNNAIKYTPVEKQINIFIEIKKNIFKLTVKDEGFGIPAEDIKNLFEPFFRGKNIRSISGSGLGLPIVKQCVERLKGEINVTSKLGEGTTFDCLLPI